VREAGGQSLRDTLRAYVRGKRMLLLLDNFEQVLDAGVEVVALLEGSPWLKVLVTSREALHVRGERPFAVPPLWLPDLTHPPDLVALAQNPAVTLFVDRAQAANPAFTLTPENAKDVAAICIELEGLPLAIELAAVRTNLLSPAGILEAFGSWAESSPGHGQGEGSTVSGRLKTLVGGSRDLPPRHQTLRNDIGWSYDLLEPDERTLFTRLGIFVGGCTLEVVQAVCGTQDSSPVDVLEKVASLLDKNLLRREEGECGESRYTMLETIREYALGRLAQGGEGDAVRRRHAQYYLALAERSTSNLHQPPEAAWMDNVEQEYGNLRAALGWATEHDPERVLRLADALGWFWQVRGFVREGRYWLDLTLAQATNVAAPIRAGALVMAGFLAHEMVDLEVAQPMLEESLSLYQELGDKDGQAWALNVLAMIASARGDYALTERLSSQSAALYDALGDNEGLSRALLLLGDSAHLTGNYEHAYTTYSEGLRLSRQSGKQRQVTRRLIRLGQIAQAQGYPMQAAPYFTEALELSKQARDKLSIAMVFAAMAGVADALGSPLSAVRLLAATDALVASLGRKLWPVDNSDYERTLTSVRTQLDTETFDAAWSKGQATQLDQMIAEALVLSRGVV
jgi:predicted ATPase